MFINFLYASIERRTPHRASSGVSTVSPEELRGCSRVGRSWTMLLVIRVAATLRLVAAVAKSCWAPWRARAAGFVRYAEHLRLCPPTLIACSAGVNTLVSGAGLVVCGLASVAALAVGAFAVGAAAVSSASSDAPDASSFSRSCSGLLRWSVLETGLRRWSVRTRCTGCGTCRVGFVVDHRAVSLAARAGAATIPTCTVP